MCSMRMVQPNERTMGAPADVSELEYISALLQSESADVPLRPDGTLASIDIRRLLLSRHGLRIPIDRIENDIFQQLAGSADIATTIDEEDDDLDDDVFCGTKGDRNNIIGKTTTAAANAVKSFLPITSQQNNNKICLDLIQVTALLFIPELERFRLESSGSIEEIDSTKKDHKSRSKEDSHQTSNDTGAIIDAALNILLNVSGVGEIENNNPESSTKTIELNTSVIREILVVLEEDDDVTDELIREMLYVAATGNIFVPSSSPHSNMMAMLPSEPVLLNRETFLNALTADVTMAIKENVLPYENLPTTHYEDAVRKIKYDNVMSIPTALNLVNECEVEAIREETTANVAKEDRDQSKNKRDWLGNFMRRTKATAHTIHETTTIVANDKTLNDPALYRIWTAPSIDTVADTYKSFWWTVIMWFTFVVLFFSYFVSSNLYSVDSRLPTIDCATADRISTFVCKCMNSVVIWLNIFIQLAVLGTAFILSSSCGNTIYHYKSKVIAIMMCLMGIVVTLFTTILAYRYVVKTKLFSTEKDNNKIGGRYVYTASVVLGSVLLSIQLANVLRMVVFSSSLAAISRLPIFAASARKLELNTKCAAKFKMRRLINNAFACHASEDVNIDSYDGLNINDGADIGEKAATQQKAKGISKASIASELQNSVLNVLSDNWQGSLSDALYNYEMQIYHKSDHADLQVFSMWRELWYTRKIGYMDGIWIHPRLVTSNLAQWLVLILIPFIGIFGFTFAENNVDYLATKNIKVWEVKVGISVGAIFSMLSIFYLATVYIPSAIATVMGFRCGSIGSLKDRQFPVHRYALDQTTILYGTAFWGALFTCAILWTLTGGVAFAAVWSEARGFVQTVLATVVGFLITLLLKLLILQILRKSWYGAFYRRKPAAANIMNIMLECWSLGLSSGYVIARIVKLLLVAIFYVGRIDTPFLAPGVGWLFNRMPIDTFPIAFRKDILSHEAHRHPYIERLSMLFIMKLHNGSNFGCRACALWRILFVRTLMPWLRKYRKRTIVSDSGFSSQHLSTSRKNKSCFLELSSTRKKRALEVENDSLRRENIVLRQKLLQQTRLNRRKSVLQLEQPKSEYNGSEGDVFYDTTND